MKVCRVCGVELIVDVTWHESCKRYYNNICIECKRAKDKQRHRENPTTSPRTTIVCKNCGKEKHHRAKGLCSECYHKSGMAPVVTCVICGEEKPHQAKGMCRECYGYKWRQENEEYRAIRGRQYHQEHRDEILVSKKQYRESHKEEIRELYYKQRKEHPERWIQYYQNSADKSRARCRKYYRDNYDKRSAYSRQWNKDNPEKSAEYTNAYRARKLRAYTEPVDRQKIFDLYCSCLYCGSKENLVLDHVVPLSRDGMDRESNLVVSCKSCNSSKSSKLLEEWLQIKPYAQAWVM